MPSQPGFLLLWLLSNRYAVLEVSVVSEKAAFLQSLCKSTGPKGQTVAP